MGFLGRIKELLKFNGGLSSSNFVVKEIPKPLLLNYLITGIDIIAKETSKARFVVKMLDIKEIPNNVIYELVFYYLLNGKVALVFNTSFDKPVILDDFTEKTGFLIDNRTSNYYGNYIVFYNPKGSSLENLKPFLQLETELINYLRKILSNAGIQGIKANIKNTSELENVYALLNIIKSKINQGNIFVLPSDFDITTSSITNIQNLLDIESVIQKVIANYLSIPETMFTMAVEKGSYALAKEQLKVFYFMVVAGFINMVKSELKNYFKNVSNLFEDVIVDTSSFWYLEDTYEWGVNEVIGLFNSGIIDRNEARKLLKLEKDLEEQDIIEIENEDNKDNEINENIKTEIRNDLKQYDLDLQARILYYEYIKPIESKVVDFLLDYIVDNAMKVIENPSYKVRIKEIFKSKKKRKTLFDIFFENLSNFISYFTGLNTSLVVEPTKEVEDMIKTNSQNIYQQRIKKLNEVYKNNIKQAVKDAVDYIKEKMNEGKTPSSYEVKDYLKDKYKTEKNYALQRVARTETNYFYEKIDRMVVDNVIKKIPNAKIYKKWLSSLDNATRHTHRVLGSMGWIPIDKEWVVNGISFKHPYDETLPAKEVVNCRCRLVYRTLEDLKEDGANIQDLEG